MTRITEVEDRGAVVSWSPICGHADIIAVGAKDSGGVGFDDYGGELELYDLNITSANGDGSPKPVVIGKVETASRFASIGWTPMNPDFASEYKLGLLVGGMSDGSLHVWDPAKISSEPEQETSSLVATISQHTKGAVSALQFNPHPDFAHEFASGGSNGAVFITSLENPAQPTTYSLTESSQNLGAEITQVAWNTQVSHIIAVSASNGSVVVYDTKQKKPWCEIRCETNGMPVSDLAWNPTEGLHIITASGDDRNPVMKLWDLRSSTSIPLATLQGHTQGILSIGWCPHDAGFLLSCGKDNKTLLWDLNSLQPIYELPSGSNAVAEGSASENIYGGSLSSSQQKRYDVQWSPIRRGVTSTCSFDRKVQIHSVISAATKSGRTPKWMKRPSGVSCGFGGSILSFRSTHKGVQIDEHVEEPELKSAAESFQHAISSADFLAFCSSRASQADDAGDQYESTMWGFMRIIFEENAREEILLFLGFDADEISKNATNYKDSLSNGVESLSLEGTSVTMPQNAEALTKRALLVGNFEAAVECCFQSGNLSDALLLSSCGGAELWAKTQARYFQVESERRPFLSIVSAVIHNELESLVEASDPAAWQETLAILSTYGKSDEFPALCLALGDRLDEAGDGESASLCYMCALNLEKAVKHWKFQLEQANKDSGTLDLLALQGFIEKVTIFLQAVEPNTSLDSEIADIFGEYADLLSSQGLLTTAASYCRPEAQSSKVLCDRLYRSKDSHPIQSILGYVPAFPFTQVNVGVEVVKTHQPASNGHYQNQHEYNQQPVSSYEQPNQQPSSSYQQPIEQLLPGWIALQDPSSNNTYYANQNTGETSWDKPAAPLPTQAAVHQAPTEAPNNYHNPQMSYDNQSSPDVKFTQNTSDNIPNNNVSPAKLASKYGDGFVSSSSHPELGEQYGNVTSSNPYGSDRPGTANVTPVSKEAVSEAFDPNDPPPVGPEVQHLSDGLLYVVNYLSSVVQTTNEKKQLSEIQKGVGIFLARLSRGDVDDALVERMSGFIGALQNKDFNTASSIQTSMVNSHWRSQKDWLKGTKFLIQLSSRKL